MRDILYDLSEGLSHPDPARRAQIQMKKPLPKRFYTEVAVVPVEGGFHLHLDGRPVKTPAKQTLLLETPALAALVKAEWDAQADVIDPGTMPVTRLANTAQDGIAADLGGVFDEIVRFAGNDMLCYRAGEPAALVERQNNRWNPVLDWAGSLLQARFVLVEGIIHQEQPTDTVAAFARALERFRQPMALACLHVVTTLSGSAILALALALRHLDAETVWTLAHLEEDWTIEHWGTDEEAEKRRAARHAEFAAAVAVYEALGL